MLLTNGRPLGVRLLTGIVRVGAKLLTDEGNLLSTEVLTRPVVGGHTLVFPDRKHPSVDTIPATKLNTQTADMPRPAIERRVGLVELAAIHILSEPLHLREVRDGLARGTVTAKPAAIQVWPPLLMTREQLCDYLQMSWSSVSKSCPVAPLDVGVNVVRYSRLQIEDWIASLPPRDKRGGQAPVPAGSASPAPEEPDDPRLAALEMARARSAKRK